VRWLREPKRWYAPNASTFLEAMDSGQATSPQSAAGLVQLCFGFVARKPRNTGAGGAERSIRMTLWLAFLAPDFLVVDAVLWNQSLSSRSLVTGRKNREMQQDFGSLAPRSAEKTRNHIDLPTRCPST
jgi:hypothetical protein